MLAPAYQKLVPEERDALSRGGSVIVSPLGEVLSGPLFDTAGVVTAELALEAIIGSKLDFDVAGHYARPDIFELTVRGQPTHRKE